MILEDCNFINAKTNKNTRKKKKTNKNPNRETKFFFLLKTTAPTIIVLSSLIFLFFRFRRETPATARYHKNRPTSRSSRGGREFISVDWQRRTYRIRIIFVRRVGRRIRLKPSRVFFVYFLLVFVYVVPIAPAHSPP